MTWVKLDDLFPDHPKIRQVGQSAAWLYVAGLCYCSRYLTDGFITKASLRGMGQYSAGQAKRLAVSLVMAGLWEEVDGGYRVHDYLDFQPSREVVKQQRDTKRKAGQAGGLARARALLEAESKHPGEPPSRPGSPLSLSPGTGTDPVPVPTKEGVTNCRTT